MIPCKLNILKQKKGNINLQICHEVTIFAALLENDRDLAQLVAHTSGGREVAGSSPVIPTLR